MKGRCQPTLRDSLLSRGVVVLESVSYSVLAHISKHGDVPIIHYAEDINSVSEVLFDQLLVCCSTVHT